MDAAKNVRKKDGRQTSPEQLLEWSTRYNEGNVRRRLLSASLPSLSTINETKKAHTVLLLDG